MIRLLLRPHQRNKTVDFKNALREATRILIFCPTEQTTVSCADQIENLTRLFSGYEIVLLHTEAAGYSPETYRIQNLFDSLVTVSNIPKGNLWKTGRSKEIQQIIDKPFDIYMDLDPDFNLLSLYLCRRLQPAVRIGLTKPHSIHFYNLLYNGKGGTPYKERLEGLYKFLRAVLI